MGVALTRRNGSKVGSADCLGKIDDRRCYIVEFVFFIIVLLVSVLAEGIIGVRFNMAGIGSIVGIALVGAILLFAIRHKK
jgi:hypothetical protein